MCTASLEDENKALKSEYSRLAQDTDDVEAQEQRLLRDITGQLGMFFYFSPPPTTYKKINNILFIC